MKNKIKKIHSLLLKKYPKPKIALNYSSPWELLVAVVLSAQCTDNRVNIITGELFKKYPSIEDYAGADPREFENDIHSAGFFRNKAKNIIASAKKVLDEHGGRVPEDMDDLLTLPGVARKSANIIAYNAYGKIYGIAVDTHVRRLSRRLGLTKENDPVKIEKDLMALIPKRSWGRFSYLLINHGRAVCKALKPDCPGCFLKGMCPRIGL